jgi:hypothetical protein
MSPGELLQCSLGGTAPPVNDQTLCRLLRSCKPTLDKEGEVIFISLRCSRHVATAKSANDALASDYFSTIGTFFVSFGYLLCIDCIAIGTHEHQAPQRACLLGVVLSDLLKIFHLP